MLLLHAAILAMFPLKAITASRLLTAVIPILLAACAFWRSRGLVRRERISWCYLALAPLLWAGGQILTTVLPGTWASATSDLLYMCAALPVLLAISHTAENESIPGILYLNFTQFALAVLLIYYRTFRVVQSPAEASSAEFVIYDWECVLLAVSAIVRFFCCSSREERQRMKCLAATVWIYTPIELGMDYATVHWHLPEGTLFDLLWSVPFLFAAWQILKLPDEAEQEEVRPFFPRAALLLQSLCPVLMTIGLFALACTLLGTHPVLARCSILAMLVLQGLHAGIVQVNYLSGQRTLLERERQLERANAGLLHLSHIDPLTGVANRRGFSEALESAWAVAADERRPISLLMIDLDFFKAINDRHGHAYGDECLASVARTLLLQGARAGDHLARYGGEEFVLMLPNTGLDGARAVAERMHRAVGSAGLVNLDSPFAKRLTVSIGVASASPSRSMHSGKLLDAADKALYEAKRTGRNQVCVHDLLEAPVLAVV
ncbi:GGDEF domain-containing protein [Silvibacterium sp.]|uniref:GGDEF domain-containing protein n=1 Tax=Silvibacterium sp. TaxID=1964179 RepID=UPI0039E4A72A